MKLLGAVQRTIDIRYCAKEFFIGLSFIFSGID